MPRWAPKSKQPVSYTGVTHFVFPTQKQPSLFESLEGVFEQLKRLAVNTLCDMGLGQSN